MDTHTAPAALESVLQHHQQLRAEPVPWERYVAANADIFPTAESWRWFLRSHRDELIERGALCFLAGKLLVRPDACNAALVEIGQRLAKARAA